MFPTADVWIAAMLVACPLGLAGCVQKPPPAYYYGQPVPNDVGPPPRKPAMHKPDAVQELDRRLRSIQRDVEELRR